MDQGTHHEIEVDIREDEGVGMAHEITSPKTSLIFPKQRWGSIG